MAWTQEQARECRNKSMRKQRLALKLKVIEAYGGKCTCCGESNPVFLCIDHVNDNGAAHREEIGEGTRKIGSGSVMHRWLAKNGFPEGFQVLCANCNLAKQSGMCPHTQTYQEQ